MPPLNAHEIATLERQLGCTLPADVRAKYEEADGWLGAKNCSFLYPYLSKAETQVVRTNVFLKSQVWFPPALAGVVIFGDDGCGNQLCFNPKTQQAFQWNPADGDWTQEAFSSMTALWAHVTRLYESAA